MLSANASLNEFVDQVSEQPYDEIILLTDREATAAERRSYKQRNGEEGPLEMRQYAVLLKDLMVYMRHGVATSRLRSAGSGKLARLPRG